MPLKKAKAFEYVQVEFIHTLFFALTRSLQAEMLALQSARFRLGKLFNLFDLIKRRVGFVKLVEKTIVRNILIAVRKAKVFIRNAKTLIRNVGIVIRFVETLIRK